MRRWGVIIWAVTCIACGGKSSNIPHDPPEAPTAVAEDQFVVSASGLKHYDLHAYLRYNVYLRRPLVQY